MTRMKAEKVKKTEGHWSSADAVDLEYFLMHASSSENRDESAQQARHWFQQHVSEHAVEEHAEFPDPKVLKAWLKHQKKQHKGGTPLPGESWQWLIGMLFWLLLFAGFLAGAGVTASLLDYDGAQPVNVAMFLCLLVGVQLIWSFVSFIVIAGKGLQWIPLHAGFSLRLLQSLMHWASTRLDRQLISKLAIEKRMFWESFWRQLRDEHAASGKFLLWPILTRIQMAGVMFNLGVMFTLMTSVVFRDLAFGWQTSMQQINDATVASVVKTLSLPWNWIWGEGQGFPSLAQIEGSRIILKDGIGAMQNPYLTSWWPFLMMAVTVYGFIPRMLLLLWLSVQERRQLALYPIQSPSCQKLWSRFHTRYLHVTTKLFDNHSQSKDNASAPSLLADNLAPTAGSAQSTVLDVPCWFYMDEGLGSPNEQSEIKSLLSPYGWQVKGVLDSSPSDDGSCFERFCSGDCLLWVEEAWQPPIQEKMKRLKASHGLLPPGVFLCVGLTGKPRGASWLTPVRSRDLEIWQKFVHQNLSKEIQIRALVAS